MELNNFITIWLQSWTGNKPEGLMQYYSDTAFYLDPARPNGLQGKAELLSYFTKLLAQNPDWVWTAEEISPTTKGCMLKWRANIPTPAGNKTVFGLDIVEIEDNKITRNEVYFDRSILL